MVDFWAVAFQINYLFLDLTFERFEDETTSFMPQISNITLISTISHKFIGHLSLEFLFSLLYIMMGECLSSSGVKAERDLVHMFWEAGFAVLRAPASGGGTVLPRPDLIAGSVKRKKFFVLEIKTIRKDTLYINVEQIIGLLEFSKRIGFDPYVGIKFKNRRKGFSFLHVPDQLLCVRNGNNYKITYTHASSIGISFGELIGDFQQEKLL